MWGVSVASGWNRITPTRRTQGNPEPAPGDAVAIKAEDDVIWTIMRRIQRASLAAGNAPALMS
jgi:hypothetical protein